MSRTRGGRMLVLLAALCVALTGCGLQIPADPDGTLDRVSGGTLRVGASPNGEFVRVDDGEVSGSEAELVQAFAESLDARVDWTAGSEEALVRELERGDLDLVIGGLTDATPWTDQAGMSRPYAEVTDVTGTTHRLVMLVPLGENAFLSELETFLTEHAPESEAAG
ncbi:transporter substrate-binding domain-containing protein [Salinibacterium sp. ZJ77]|uniref:transporter substrate-binding domain-containing protein n=1 Tax=Salinibacterium sp. ZJ77 TaxID=2708337 RepID=UPI001FBAC1E8|nr:transporter substrate-binding domain-containing protein [Salinibacterium sp. ZJ77]